MREEGLPRSYRIIDPRTGETVATGERRLGEAIADDQHRTRLVIFYGE